MVRIGIPINLGTTCGIGSSYYTYFSEILEDVELILLPPAHTLKELDLLVLPGGADVLPTRYGGVPGVSQSYADPVKEYFDAYWLPKYIESGTPILGICRGHQTLGVHFNAKLEETYHDTNDSTDPGKKVHKVYLNKALIGPLKNTYLFSFMHTYKGLDFFGVNSRHHQGYRVRKGGEMVCILSDDPNLSGSSTVEAAAHPTLPIVSVQWHPEDLYDLFTSIVIEHLVTTRKSILSVLP